jgi:hypothetical protein
MYRLQVLSKSRGPSWEWDFSDILATFCNCITLELERVDREGSDGLWPASFDLEIKHLDSMVNTYEKLVHMH